MNTINPKKIINSETKQTAPPQPPQSSPHHPDIIPLSILSATPLLGSIKIQLLVRHFGSPAAALEADPADVKLLPGFTDRVMAKWGWWNSDKAWERNIELAERYGAHIIPFTSEKYPKKLLEITDHPILLYVKGEIRPIDQRSIAVVGTRNACIYGLEMAESISENLAAQGFTVISGLARGVDTKAHEGALKRGRTIAVIGSGLADIYPRENLQLADMISKNGAMISEFPMATPPDRQNFPQRNRIVSALTMGTLLIEAPAESGAMITMDRAHQQKKKLFALPGRVDNPNFKGNHLLIKSGRAQLVENAEDIIGTFENLFSLPSLAGQNKPNLPPLEKEEKELLESLPAEELSIEKIVELTKLSVIKINILLMSLVVKKMIKEYPGRFYRKIM